MINENYFETIDTNEKAYWLGFLYADGYIGNKNEKLQICLSVKDESHLDKFIICIGSELSCKRYYGPYKTSGKQVHWYTKKRKIVNDLIKLGCTNKKSHTIRFPKLNSHDFNCAFLLGYYDGDGSATPFNTKIACGNINFLKDIKKIFYIDNVIYTVKNTKYETYTMNISRSVFESILPHYTNSLENKRIIFEGRRTREQYLLDLKTKREVYNESKPIKTNNENNPTNIILKKFDITKEELQKLINECTVTQIAKMFDVTRKTVYTNTKLLGIVFPNKKNYHPERKFHVTKEELEKLLAEHPMTHIAKMFNVSDKAISKRAKVLGIEFKNSRRGYWAKFNKAKTP